MRRRAFLTAAAAVLAAAPRLARAQPAAAAGVLKHVGVEPASLDIHLDDRAETQMVSSLVRRGLFKVAAGDPSDAGVVPDLARAARVSRDGRIYTITLRQEARWEDRAPVDGRPVTAADVQYSLERARRRSTYAPRLGPLEHVEAPDAHTLRLHLAAPFTPLLAALAEPWTAVLPRELEERGGDVRGPAALLGCGPFTLARWEPGVKAVFARNPRYHARGLPRVDRLEWLFLDEPVTRLALFRAGQVDVPAADGTLPRAEGVALRHADPRHPLQYWEPRDGHALALRGDVPPFQDVRVRRALSLALDRRRWVREDLDGEGMENPGPVPAPMREWKLSAEQHGAGARWLRHDPAQARALLAEAGFAQGLRVRCAAPAGLVPEAAADLVRVRASLQAVGVELQVVEGAAGRLEEAAWAAAPAFGDVDVYLSALYRAGDPRNLSRVADPALEALLDTQRRVTGAARRRVIADIQRLVTDRVYYVFPPTPRRLASWSPRVRAYRPTSSLDRGAQLELVWLDPA